MLANLLLAIVPQRGALSIPIDVDALEEVMIVPLANKIEIYLLIDLDKFFKFLRHQELSHALGTPSEVAEVEGQLLQLKDSS